MCRLVGLQDKWQKYAAVGHKMSPSAGATTRTC